MIEDIAIKIIVALVVGLLTALGGWLVKQVVKYKGLIKKEEDETVKNTIVKTLQTGLQPIQDSIGGLKNDMSNMKNDIANMQTNISNMKKDIANLQKSEINFSTRLNPMQEEIEHLKDDITEILTDLKRQGVDLNNIREQEELLAHETRCAWRYRIRQLCHVYIARGYMSFDEFSQLQEMYNIYAAIGGNGQTKELYDQVGRIVEIKSDAEIALLNQ